MNNPQGQGSIFNRTAIESDAIPYQMKALNEDSLDYHDTKSTKEVAIEQTPESGLPEDLTIPPPDDFKVLKKLEQSLQEKKVR